MINEINNMLLVILVILVIFCIGVYLYTDTNISNIIYHERFDNIVDNKTLMLELMETARQNATKILKEKFAVDNRLILQNDAENYYNNLNAMQSWLDDTYNGEYGILAKIKAQLQTTAETRDINKKSILTLLTNIYIINYINFINKQNAESYKMFLKYEDPKNNKYYNQYLV
jgi:hypothetical protein